MPYDDPDPQDPMMLVGVNIPADRETQVDMAYAFAEEYARLGYGEREILGLFRQRFYSGTHGLYESLGAREVEAIIQESVGAWGRMRVVDRVAAPCADASDAEEGDHE